MADNETTEALIAEYRADAEKMDAHELPQPTTRYLRILLGRLEAALKREADSIHRAMVILAGIEMPDPDYPPKLWTALEDAYDALSDALGTDGETTADEEEAKANGRHFVIQPRGDCAKLREALEFAEDELWAHGLFDASKRIESALAAPPRNCDVGTPEEQSKRCFAYCNQYICKDCPCNTIGRCTLVWAQMPYEAEKGANNG